VRHRELESQTAEPKLFGRPAYDRSALLGPASAARWLLVFILLAGAYFFHGFLVPVLAAVVIGFASWPLYRRLLVAVNGNRTIGATIAIILVVAFIVTPVTFAIIYAVDEFRGWVGWAVEANSVGAAVPAWVLQLPLGGVWLGEQWAKYVGHPGALGELVQLLSGSNIGNIYRGALAVGAGAARSLLTLLFMLITLFFVYRDGEKFVLQLDRLGERILPMRWERVSRIVPLTISSTVTGMGLIAIGEGIVLGIAYWIAGVPSPVTLGIITGLMALIPGGAPLCFTLVSVYLLASGSPVAGFALFAWGTIELFIVDKTLRPRLVGGPIKLPFLPTFFGLVGGVKTMGFLGLFVGPVLMALIVAIWREWLHEVTTPAPEPGTKLIKPV
jgi:predicted PurR-regulated permease PerM